MIRKIRIGTIVCTLLFSLVGVGNAETGPANYVVLKAGGFFPQSSDLDGFDTGIAGELAAGHYFTPNFGVEVGVGGFGTEGDFVDPFFGLGTVGEDFEVIAVRLSGIGRMRYGNVEPYGLVGVGVHFVEDKISVAGGSTSEDDTNFGFHIGLGANVNLSPNFFLGIEGRYIIVQTGTFGVDVNLDGLTLTGNLGYRF